MDTPSTMSLCILPTLSNIQISQNVRHVECEIHVISWIKISSCKKKKFIPTFNCLLKVKNL